MLKELPDPIDVGLVRRALVTKLRHHGDVLLTSPVFTVLKRALPAAEIDALVKAVRSGTEMTPSLTDGMRAQAVAEAAVASLTQGKPVAIRDVWTAGST